MRSLEIKLESVRFAIESQTAEDGRPTSKQLQLNSQSESLEIQARILEAKLNID